MPRPVAPLVPTSARTSPRGAAVVAVVVALTCLVSPGPPASASPSPPDDPVGAARAVDDTVGGSLDPPTGRRPADGAYAPPVAGAVLRPFDAPDGPYAPGHRGVDLEARAGQEVRAAGAGVIAFAGRAGIDTWVTVAHPDGLRTTYGGMATLAVAAGDRVARGQVVGTATGTHGDGSLRAEAGLHWSVRRGEVYLDPLELLDTRLPRPTLVGPGGWRGSHLVVEPWDEWPGGSHWGLMAPPSAEVSRQGWTQAPNHHHLVVISGYGTTGDHPVMDPRMLGYDDDSWSAFSYTGCDPTPAGCVPQPYGVTDTDLPIAEAARLLDQQLRAVQAAQAHRPVDLLGHSQGGDIAAYYLEHVYDPSDRGLPPVRNLMTVATPHQGSGSAYAGRAVGDTPFVGHLVEGLRRGAVRLGFDDLDRIRFGSEPLRRYGGAFGSGRPERDTGRLRELGVDILAIAGSRDLVVGRSDAAIEPSRWSAADGGWTGSDVIVTDGGHSSVTRKESTYAAVRDHLAGDEVTGAGGAAGWGSDSVAGFGRAGGAVADVGGWALFGSAAVAGKAGRTVWEGTKLLAPGPNQTARGPDHPDDHPMAPAAPGDALG